MSPEKLLLGIGFVAVLCITALISQCTYSISQCRIEAIKANIKPEVIEAICRS